MVPVFNHTKRQLGIGIARRKAGTPGQGAAVYTVDFAPGNNSIDSRELAKCQDHPSWGNYVTESQKSDLTGRRYKAVDLTVGLHDEEFDMEFKSLGERMQQMHEKRTA